MDKATVNMTNWELYVYEDHYSLSGTADIHPALGKNVYVSQTSSLVEFNFSNDVLVYETKNTIYICPLKYMVTWPYQNVVVGYREELTHRADSSDNILDKIIAATAKISIMEARRVYEDPGKRVSNYFDAICEIDEDYSRDSFASHIIALQEQGQKEIEYLKQQENNRLISIASNYEDCVYIEVSNVACGSLLAYHLGENLGVVYPCLHSGMIQDSVLYMKCSDESDSCALDFRYFPKGLEDEMETYSWSDNIARVVINNDTNHSLRFNRIDVPEGETVIFTPNGHRQGLISPDCYNGKSIFSITNEGDSK